MTKKSIGKTFTYHEVLDALKTASGCPLCELEANAMRRYLEGLLYESVNDPGVRATLIASRGYCLRHAHQLLAFQSGLGVAILYRDQVGLFLDFLKTAAPPSRKKRPPAWTRHEPCPACTVQQTVRERAVRTLAHGLNDDALRQALEAAPGLCVPHFLLAWTEADGTDGATWLLEIERRRFEELQRDLDEFQRKHDYRFSGEPFGREKDAWIRAVRMMVGSREVFSD